MKSRATIEDIRKYASLPWDKACRLRTTGTYEEHLGKLAVPFDQRLMTDGTMHGYTDAARELYTPSDEELKMRWGVAESLRDLQRKIPFIYDERFFACHMWHESPDRTDWNKNMSPEERF